MYMSTVEHDPNLTHTGTIQAAEAAKHFKQRVAAVQEQYDIVYDEVRIESSPFVRCLQTASRAALELERSQIYVNYRICETLWEEHFEEAHAGVGIFTGLNLKN